MSAGRIRSLRLVLAAIIAAIASTPSAAREGLAPAGEWVPFDDGPETTCADGSSVSFLERRADPQRVVLYFEGGGACFSAETCAFDGPDKSYVSSSVFTPEDLAERGGIFDLAHPENPLAGYSLVYVPYCTGDVHLGTSSHAYADDLVVEHKGYRNGTAALEHVVAGYPDVTQLVVAGVSAGSVSTPLYAGLAADLLPGARIVTLGDGSGAFPSDPVLNAYVGSLWGTAEAIPGWPETEGLGVRDWGVPDLYRYAGLHAPDVTFARFDFAYDATQAAYTSLVGVAADEVVGLTDENEATIEASGVPLASYTAPGRDHTILWRPEFYELEVEGVRLVDWVRELIEGGTPADVRCEDCDESPLP